MLDDSVYSRALGR